MHSRSLGSKCIREYSLGVKCNFPSLYVFLDFEYIIFRLQETFFFFF